MRWGSLPSLVLFLLGPLLMVWPCAGQTAEARPPSGLQIRVTDGAGMVYALESRATRGITVQVTDETGQPVEGAAVTFELPADGPTGAFNSGERVETVTTDADGSALVWGMQWNRTAGSFDVRITAVKGEVRAGTVCPLHLSDALLSSAPVDPGRPRVSKGHKKLWVALAVTGALVLAVAAAAATKPAATAAAATPAGPQIGPPTLVIGKP